MEGGVKVRESGGLPGSLKRGRALTAGLTALPVLTSALVQSRLVGGLILVLYAAVELNGLFRLSRLLQSIRSGSGDRILPTGERVGFGPMVAYYRVFQHEKWLCYLGFLGVLSSVPQIGWPGLAWGFFTLIPVLMVRASARTTGGAARVLGVGSVLIAGRVDEAAQRLKKLGSVHPSFHSNVLSLRSTVAARQGRVDEAMELLESSWDGAVAPSAVPLALARLERGQRSLIDELLAGGESSNAYERYLLCVAAAHRDLLDGRYQAVLDGTEARSEWPETLAEPLLLLRAAAQRALGQDSELSEELERRYAWWEHWYPAAWAILHGDRPPEVEPLRPRPVVAPEPAPVDRRRLGVVPFEWLPVGRNRGAGAGRSEAARLGLLGVMFALGLLLGPITILLRLAGSPDVVLLAASTGMTVVALVMPLQELARRGLVRWSQGGDRRVVLSNGSAVNLERMALWSFSRKLILGPVLLLVVGSIAAEYLLQGSVSTVTIAAPVGLLFGWIYGRVAVLEWMIQVAHTQPPSAWIRFADRVPGWLILGEGVSVIRGLGCLWGGDREGARASWQRVVVYRSQTEELSFWLGAGDGDVDLDHLIGRGLPDALGPAYRAGVAMLLAAIRAGQESAVPIETRARLHEVAERLPNRFGELLGALVARVEDRGAALPEDLEWIEAVWPGLWRGQPAEE